LDFTLDLEVFTYVARCFALCHGKAVHDLGG